MATKMDSGASLRSALHDTIENIHRAVLDHSAAPSLREYGIVTYVGPRRSRACGGCRTCSRKSWSGSARNVLGMTFNLDPEDIGVILLDEAAGIESGAEVRRTNGAGYAGGRRPAGTRDRSAGAAPRRCGSGKDAPRARQWSAMLRRFSIARP